MHLTGQCERENVHLKLYSLNNYVVIYENVHYICHYNFKAFLGNRNVIEELQGDIGVWGDIESLFFLCSGAL